MQYFVTLLMADTFSSKLYMHLGFSEGTTGILNSIISLAFIVQLLSIVLVKNRRIAKTLVIIFSISSHILFGCIYLTPYLPFSEQTRRALALVFVILAYSLLYFVASICYKWANSFVHPGKRGLFGAIKEMISLSGGVIFALIMAYVIGVYEKAGNLTGGFAFIAIMIFVITACDLVCLLLIKRDPPESMLDSYKKDFKKTFKYLFTNKNYVNIIILTVLYYCATYFIVGFIGSYKNALLGTVLAATIVNTVASGFRFAVSIPLGRFADKHSYAKGFELGLAISAFAYLCCVFTTDSTWYLIIGYAVLISIGLAGLDSSGINMVYNYVDLDYIEDGMALRTCIGGLFGFVAALVAGRLVDLIKANPPVIFGIAIAPQQILALVSFILVIAAILFVHFVISKQRARIQ
jgi:Na+/melibiose symporter-like transporter